MYTIYFSDYAFDIFPGSYTINYDDTLNITIPAENIGIDFLESILQNPNNLQVITVYDNKPELYHLSL